MPKPSAQLSDLEPLIVTVRGHRVIHSADLARVYGVLPKALNQAVRRNAGRFPSDFAFRPTVDEARRVSILRSQSVTLGSLSDEVVVGLRSQSVTLDGVSEGKRRILRSQSVILGRGTYSKYLPWAFTEHGALMAATVLNSPKAVQMSVFVVRAFLRLRQVVAEHKQLAAKLAKLERRVTGHDSELKSIIVALRQLLTPPDPPPRRRIGFARDSVLRADLLCDRRLRLRRDHW